MPVPTSAFGPGSRRTFADYFEGESHVPIGSIEDIADWLKECEYVTDADLFHERDFWQHPATFEQLRRGDCEDFALWTWRKLVELGIEAEFYVGRVLWTDDSLIHSQHAWVVYRVNRIDFIFEPATRNKERMIRRLSDAKNEYVPHFSVNREFGTSAFLGCVLDASRDRRRRRDPTFAA